MGISADMLYDVTRKMLVKYPRFGSEIADANIEFIDDLPFHTAATDGKNIYVDLNYFESLSEDDRLFTIAHEIMHIKFMHMYRLKDKDGKKRNLNLWNIATDAIINANLERDGFTIKEGYVNMPEALNYSAEEFYEILLKEKENQQKAQENQEQNQGDSGEQSQDNENKESNQNGKGGNQEGKQEQNENPSDGNSEGKKTGKENEQPSHQGDDHSLWEEAFRNQQQGQKADQKQEKNEAEKQKEIDGQPQMTIDERSEFEDNRQEKRERFKARREKTKHDIRGIQEEESIKLGSIGESRENIDWKTLLRREVEKTETIWSQKRSIAENNYAYRLEENDIEDEAETEIMIDVSGSVNLDLVKAFLRQIKPILKQSKLKVGCFNERFWGLVDIKNERDIDNFTIPREARGSSAWTEDWDLAVRSFTKKKEINKIVFTDGYPCPGTMPKEDLKRENIIWLVYGNKAFNPCCGKVINITERQLEQLHLVSRDDSIGDVSR